MLLQFLRKNMEQDLFSEVIKDLNREDTGLFVDLINIRKQISKIPYFKLRKKWKDLKING